MDGTREKKCKNAILAGLTAAEFALVANAGALPPPALEMDGFRCWHDIAYGPRGDLPDEGDGYTGKRGGWSNDKLPWKFHRHRSGQLLDVYAPTNGLKPNATVVLYIHGGSWSECYDKDIPPYALFKGFLDAGAIACTADYILQTDRSLHWFKAGRKEATFAQMIRDIDAAVTKIREFVRELGVDSPHFVVMGESAGGHLALLYAYDQGNPDWMGLDLAHSLRVDKVVNIVGPTDFTAKDFREVGEISIFGLKLGINVFAKLMNRLLGLADGASKAESIAAAAKWSPIKLVCAKSASTVIAYGAIGKKEESDGLVPVSQMTSLEAALKSAGVPCAAKRFSGANHCEVTSRGAQWIVSEALRRE